MVGSLLIFEVYQVPVYKELLNIMVKIMMEILYFKGAVRFLTSRQWMFLLLVKRQEMHLWRKSEGGSDIRLVGEFSLLQIDFFLQVIRQEMQIWLKRKTHSAIWHVVHFSNFYTIQSTVVIQCCSQLWSYYLYCRLLLRYFA